MKLKSWNVEKIEIELTQTLGWYPRSQYSRSGCKIGKSLQRRNIKISVLYDDIDKEYIYLEANSNLSIS